MQENGGSSRTEEGESPSVLAFFVSCPGTCNISAGMSAARWLQACIDATSLLSVSREHRHDLLALLSVFGRLGEGVSYIAQRRGDRPPRYGEKTPPLHVGRWENLSLSMCFAIKPHHPYSSGSSEALACWFPSDPDPFGIGHFRTTAVGPMPAGIRPPPKAG